jgi:hypothetical protein
MARAHGANRKGSGMEVKTQQLPSVTGFDTNSVRIDQVTETHKESRCFSLEDRFGGTPHGRDPAELWRSFNRVSIH